MKFPVDLLADVSQAELERLSHNYMYKLLYSNPDSPEHLTLSDSTQVTIDISSVGSIPLYGSNDKQKILALFSPRDPFTAVALYLLDQWWTVDDILKTADPARDGAVQVETVGERIVLYILNRVIYRAKEMSSEELPFLCHGEKDNAKILWNNGEAVGFYSIKPSGSLYHSHSTRSYQLPVMDSIFVRQGQRGKGFGLQMLKDFVLSFKEDCLGLRFPLTKSMYKVCEKYLCQYPEDTDLLWEVQSIGGPNQRTNIASKIQALDLTAVSKRLLFTEITEATKKDVVMEAITTQENEVKSMECTVEIVEEVTVLRATKAVAARGRSTGSKQRKVVEKITEDKSEKVIRIEDIEAETPREEQATAQQTTELHNVSDLVQTEGMFSVVSEEKGEHVVDAAPEEEAATIPDNPATAHTTEEPQVEDDTMQELNNPRHDSQITVENVVSEIEGAERQKEDISVLVVSEEVLQVYKEAESLIKERKGAPTDITDEKSEEIVTQHVEGHLTHATSEDDEAGRTIVKAIQTVQSETLRWRSQQHRKPEEEATAQHGGRVLRGRTVMSTTTPKRKYKRHCEKACRELEKEVDEVSATKVAQELAVTKGDEPEEITSIKEDSSVEEKQRLQQLTNEEETEGQDPRDTAVKGSSAELPGTADTEFPKEIEHEKATDQSETSVIQEEDKQVPDDVQEQTDEADLGAGGSTGEEIADEKSIDNEQVGEYHQAEQDEAVDKTEEDVSTEKVTVVEEGAIEVNMEEETEVGTETVLVMGADKEPDTVAAASETVIPNEVLDEAAVAVAEENNDSKIPKLHTATVILVDLKTAYHHPNVKEVQKTPVDGECVAPENEQMELIAAEEKDEEDGGKQENSTERSVDATADTAPVVNKEIEADYCDKDKEEFANIEEEESKVNAVPVEEKQSAVSEICAAIEADIPVVDDEEENRLPAEVDEAISLEEEEAPVVETRALRNGTKTVATTPRHKKTRNKKQADEQEAKNCEEEEPAVRRERISAAATPKEESMRTCRQIQEGQGESKGVAGTGGEEEEAVEQGAVEKTDEEVENTAAVTSADHLVQDGERLTKPTTDSAILTPNEEDATPLAERQQSEEMAPQLSELQRLTVVLVDLKKGQRDIQEETAAVKEGNHVAEGEEEQREEPMADENVPSSLVGIERTLEKVEVEGFDEKGEDAITIRDSGDERAEENAEEDEAKSVDDAEEKEELAVTETRTQSGKKQAVKASLMRTSARSRQKMGEEEASEIQKEEHAIQVRVLRRGRKSIPVTKRCTAKRTYKHIQEEEEEGGEESTAEEREAEEEEEQEQMIDQEKGRILEENNAAQHVEPEPEIGIEKAPTAAGEAVIQDAPNEGQADEGKIENNVAVTTQDAVEGEQSTSTSEVAETAAGEETPLTAKVSEEDVEVPGIQTRVLESSEKTVRATTRSKPTKIQDDEQEEEATGEKSTEEDEPAVETRVERRKRRSAAATPRPKSKRARTEIQVEETIADGKEDNSDKKTQEKNGEEAAAQKEKCTQPEVEMEKVEAVAEESVTEQETVEEDQSVVSETCAGGQEETPTADKGKGTGEEEVPVVEIRVLRSSGKTVKATPRPKTTKSQQEENEQDGTVVDSSADTDESAVETRVQRKGRRAVPATPTRKSKRARTQYQPEEEEEEPTPAEQTEEEEEDGEKAEEEERSMEMEMNKEKDVEEVECVAGGESAAEQMKDALAKEIAVPKKENNSETAVSETTTDAVKTSSAEVEETNSAEGEEATVTEESTAAAEVGSNTAIAIDEALAENDTVVVEEEAPAVTTRTKASRRSRRQREYDEENGEDGTEAATEEEEEHRMESDLDDKKGECLEDEPIDKQEENSGGENFEISSDKGGILNLVLDSDEQLEAAGSGQEDEEDGPNMSEEEVEPIVIGARDLRGRLVPSVVITPRSKSRRSHAKVLEAEESLSDEGKSPQMAPKRTPRKRKSTELTPSHKVKRHSRV